MTTQLTYPRIILDTEPGGDDIYAFLWLLSLVKSGLAELVAVTSADGNVAAKRTFSSASQILNLAGFPEIKVGRGVPIKQVVENAGHIHGADGMGNLSHTLPPPTHNFEDARYWDEIIIDELNANPGEITIISDRSGDKPLSWRKRKVLASSKKPRKLSLWEVLFSVPVI
ncbi:nucleoside hydrolase [Microcoleus sp. OTE_8_concoct_300]|uniref:nucleoside hydrolase n=1 Tax=Microcoleus sp. OTE_8_concoct_300 TaxID=2964710 RepID=UPI00403F192E